jgi:prepilin-type processing-associated H-X9-DG protein
VPVLNGLSPDNELWFQNKLFVRIVSLKGRYNPEAEQGYNALTLPRDFRCPTDNRTVGKGFILYADGTIEGVSYGMNGMSLYSKDGWHYYEQHSPTKPRMAHALTTSQVVKPSSKLFFMDAVWHVVDYGAADYVRYWDKYGDQMGRWAWDAPSYRHSEGANVLFYDGHVKYMQKQEIYQRPPGLTVPQQWRLNMQLWQPIPGRSYIDKPYN